MNPETFTQKLYNTYDLIVRNEIQAAHLAISQLVGKKKNNKKKGKKAKKKKLSDQQESVILLLEAMCCVKEGRYGEASAILDNYFMVNKDDFDEANKSMISFLSINLEKQDKALAYFSEAYKKNPNDPEVVKTYLKFAVNAYNFSKIQSVLMKMSKNDESSPEVKFLASIFIQFLNFRRMSDEYLREKPDGKMLKILQMFCKKAKVEITKVEDATTRKKLHRDLVELEIQLNEANANNEAIFKIIAENLPIFEYTEHIDVYLRMIGEAEESQKVDNLLLCLQGFNDTLNLQFKEDNPVANFNRQIGLFRACDGLVGDDLALKFIGFFKGRDHGRNLAGYVKLFDDEFAEIGDEFELKDHGFFTEFFFQNLRFLRKFALGEKEDKFRSKNYILLLLTILHTVSKKSEISQEDFEGLFKDTIEDLISLYCQFYKKTASILHELFDFLKESSRILDLVESNLAGLLESETSDATKCTIDFHLFQIKMLKSGELLEKSKEENLKLFEECVEKFKIYENLIYGEIGGSITVNKGDRLPTDFWLETAIEIIRCLESIELDEQQRSELRNTLLCLISFAKRTPYNFDITLREAELNSKLCLYFENDELYKLKDLKGNQYDTLSYIFYKNQITIPMLGFTSENVKMTYRFYDRQHRDNPNGFNNAIKHCNLKTIDEFFIFDRLILNSQFRSALNTLNVTKEYLEYARNGKIENFKNLKFFVERNLPFFTKEKQLSFNYDLPLLQPNRFLTSKLYFNDFLGCFSNPKIHGLNFLTASVFGFLTQVKSSKFSKEDLTLLRTLIGMLNDGVVDVDKMGEFEPFGVDYEEYYVMRRINDPFKEINAEELKPRVMAEEQAREEFKFVFGALKTFSKILNFFGFFFDVTPGSHLTSLEGINLANLETEVSHLWELFDANCVKMFSSTQPFLKRDLIFQNFFLINIFSLLSGLYKHTKNLFKTNINAYLKQNEMEGAKEFFTFLKQQKQVLLTKIKDLEKGMEELANLEVNTAEFGVIAQIQNLEFLDIEGTFEAYLKKYRDMLMDLMAKISIYGKTI